MNKGFFHLLNSKYIFQILGFPGGLDSEESACNTRNLSSIPGLGRSPGGGHGNLLHYSCLENPTDRGVWQATLHRVAESDMTEVTYHEHMQGRDWGTMEKTQSSARKTIVL